LKKKVLGGNKNQPRRRRFTVIYQDEENKCEHANGKKFQLNIARTLSSFEFSSEEMVVVLKNAQTCDNQS